MSDYEQLLSHVPYALLVIFRIAGLLVFAPVLSSTAIFPRFKAALAVTLGIAIYPTMAVPPAEAIPLYGSATCANQGFVWKERAIGLQCHLESTPDSIEAMLQACAADLELPGSVEDAVAIRDGFPHCSALAPTLFRLLDYLTGPHASLT